MIKIVKALPKDNLDKEWNAVNLPHYGQEIRWFEKPYSFKAVYFGKIIGKIEGKLESGVLYISALMTAAKFRSRGVGSKLIAHAESWAKKQGAHRTWLVTGKHWGENAFYLKLGFTKIANLPDFYFHTDFVIYSREIK